MSPTTIGAGDNGSDNSDITMITSATAMNAKYAELYTNGFQTRSL
ncbi:hypothetical protein [Natronolimnobius sp. AArcel1]|nr:hypothetical protein [Natronolimnobius sp. AArcel1]